MLGQSVRNSKGEVPLFHVRVSPSWDPVPVCQPFTVSGRETTGSGRELGRWSQDDGVDSGISRTVPRPFLSVGVKYLHYRKHKWVDVGVLSAVLQTTCPQIN